MATQVPARNGGTLTRPDKGETMNPNGRPRKYVSQLKEQGYKLSEVNDAIQALMSMDVEELSAVLENPKATILELTIAKAMVKPDNAVLNLFLLKVWNISLQRSKSNMI